jgi:hypothetical protein
MQSTKSNHCPFYAGLRVTSGCGFVTVFAKKKAKTCAKTLLQAIGANGFPPIKIGVKPMFAPP